MMVFPKKVLGGGEKIDSVSTPAVFFVGHQLDLKVEPM